MLFACDHLEAARQPFVWLLVRQRQFQRFQLGVDGGIMLALQSPFYAALLYGWTAVYLVVVTWLARRCVVLSKSFSDEVSTSTGRLIDAISNADLVRAFARAGFERAAAG